MEHRTRLKSLLTAGAVAVAVAVLFVAADPYAPTYEMSVYDGYGTTFWVLLFGAVFLGQVVIFESGQSDAGHRYWKWGLALVLGVLLVFLTIPAIRYHLYARGDMLTYIGMIREIGNVGTVPRSNYYPNVHLFALAFSYATGIPPSDVINFLPPVITVFYVVSAYLLLDVFFSDSRQVLFVLPFVSLPLLGFEHVFFHPSVFAFMLLPFVLTLLFRSYGGRSKYRFKVVILVTIVSLVFYHPAVTLFFTGVLTLLKLSFVAGRRLTDAVPRHETTSLTASALGFILFFSWYYSFDAIIGSTLGVLYSVLGMSEGSSSFENISGVLGRTSPKLTDVALTGIYTYGLIGATIAVGFVFLGFYVYLVVRGRRRFDPIEAFLGSVLVVFTVGGVVAFFVDVTLAYYRILRYARFAAAVLIGIGFYTLFRRLDRRTASRHLRPLLYVSFFAFAFLSMFLVYGSPLSNDRNLQITDAEVEGSEWLFDYRNESLFIDQMGIDQYRMYNFVQSTRYGGENIRWSVPPPPMHFDYANASVEDVYSGAATDRRYLVTTRLARTKNQRFYPQYREYWRHNPEDFARLERHPSFSNVYDDGTLNTYVVRGVGSQRNASTSDAT